MSKQDGVRASFDSMLALRQDTQSILHNLGAKISKLKETYNELLRAYECASDVFGIDSFYFQSSLLETEHANMSGLFNRIDNRVYCDYYSLHRLIVDYVRDNVRDALVVKKVTQIKPYPPYKSLEPTKTYPLGTVLDIQGSIMSAITELENYLASRETILATASKQSELGMNIDNLVLSQKYSNVLLRERIRMYWANIESFNTHHTKYFTRLHLKLQLLAGVVNEDISVSGGRTNRSKTQTNVATTSLTESSNIIPGHDDASPDTRHAINNALARSVSFDEEVEYSPTSNDVAETITAETITAETTTAETTSAETKVEA